MKTEIASLTKKKEHLEMATKQVEYMNRKNRRNNIIITGMKIEVTKKEI